jgi:hypothetical protein
MTTIRQPTSKVMKGALLAMAVLGAECGPERTVPPDSPHLATSAAPFTDADVRAYLVGRRREIDLTNAALVLLPCAVTPEQRAVLEAGATTDGVEPDAAAKAGLALASYRRLTGRVDSALVPSVGGRDSATHLTDPLFAALDSLRVRLVVLRARVNAEMAQPIHVRRSSCSAQ